ncbi:Uncharacterised protein [uncultured archaeon]|nr:Uncharacterised protein [uncultured archaeon]
MEKDTNRIEFTYFGDLLGTSELYNIHRDVGYNQLDKFYKIMYDDFKQLVEEYETTLYVYLFSDSLFITGKNNIEMVLKTLSSVYYKLFSEKIFLRGAMVEGYLNYDPRVELRNFRKQLPTTDVLFRATKLEKSSKGARLLIEKGLAQKILHQNWYTEDTYIKNFYNPKLPNDDFKRKIVQNGYQAYEYLWPLEDCEWLKGYLDVQELLKEKAYFAPNNVINHLRETRKLFRIAKYRFEINNHLRRRPIRIKR